MSLQFHFDSCKFKIQKSKEGTGRIVMWNMGILNSYTMEVHFYLRLFNGLLKCAENYIMTGCLVSTVGHWLSIAASQAQSLVLAWHCWIAVVIKSDKVYFSKASGAHQRQILVVKHRIGYNLLYTVYTGLYIKTDVEYQPWLCIQLQTFTVFVTLQNFTIDPIFFVCKMLFSILMTIY